jgi:Protein of unknown function (DUF2971)
MTPSDPLVEVGAQLDALYLELRKDPSGFPERLFHYTDPDGFVGITVNHRLRASNADFLNDSSEPEYALDLLKGAFEKVSAKILPGSIVGRALDGFWGWATQEQLAHGPHLYVFCLSEVGDLLSQWRAYGGRGAGYAIGFSACGLFSRLRRSEGQYLVKVTYDPNLQRSNATEVFEQIISIMNQYEWAHGNITVTVHGDDAHLVENKIRTAFLSEIIRLRAQFKIRAFQEEAEWRIVQFAHPAVDKPPVQFRPGVDSVKPYVELDLQPDTLPIEQINIGPALKPDLARKSASLLLAKASYSGVVVSNSIVPFRL